MVKKIIWTPKAEKSFDDIIDYLHEHWSEEEIVNLIEKVHHVIFHITHFPLSHRNAGKANIRQALIIKHNVLIYRVADNSIYILYFWDTRKNPIKKPI